MTAFRNCSRTWQSSIVESFVLRSATRRCSRIAPRLWGLASESPESQTSKRTRHVAAAVAREVYVRDEGRCTFCSDNGRRCGERRLLQLDHVVPHAEGGEPRVTNLRLRCRAHNLHTARVHFGREHVRAAAERAREPTRRAGFDAQRLDWGHLQRES